MAKYLTNIELEGNQLINALIHPLGSAPTALGDGQMYYNTATDNFWGRRNGAWEEFAMVGSASNNIDHGSDLNGLADDDHTQYALLAGRAAGQTLRGGANASGTLILGSTSNVTKGYIELEDATRLTTSGTTTFATAGVQFVLRATSSNDELQNVAVSGTASSSTFLRGDGTWSTPAGGYSSWTATADAGGPDTVNDGDTIDWAGGTGISTTMTGGGTANVTITADLDLDNLAEKTGNLVATDRLTGVSGTTHFSETISAIPLSIFNNDSGWTDNTGTVTSVGITDGNLIDSSGGPITTSGNITINVDLSELATSVTNGDGDFFVVVDSTNGQHKLTKANIALSGFNNDSGWTSNTGTVTNVGSGNGMNFSAISTTGNVVLGTPSSVTGTSTNSVTANSHTHELDLSAAASTELSDTANIVYTNAARTINVTHTIATGSDLIITDQPTSDTHAANKLYVDTVAQGLDAKESVRAATTTNGALATAYENNDVIDGVTLSTGDRILIKNQTAQAENGIYTVNATGAPTRATDADTWDELVSAFVFVEEGTTNGDTGWVCTVDAGGTLGTTAVTWAQFSGAGTYTAGVGIELNGSEFRLNASTGNDNGINFAADTFSVARLANGGIILNSNQLQVDLAASNLANSLSRTDIATGSANHVVINDGTGALSSEATLAVSRGGTGLGSTPTNGQLLIGDGVDYALATLTPGAGIDITNGAGTIQIDAETATVTNPGIIEIATQAEVDTGTDADRAVTPDTLRGTPDLSGSYSAGGDNISTRKFVKGTAASTSTTVTHNFGTREVIVQIFDATSYDTVYADVVRTNTNTVTVTFATATTLNEYVIVVIG